ncbi:hypothetical protein [Streptomyces sp. NBC_00118]|uniref:hypothetical protein n=1 Tax=unclassified Streptomyces TaxID=2593676 RepID=UPI003092796C|nr:hypothetical protein OG518_26545 [Streptomyces sp. NBC_01397]
MLLPGLAEPELVRRVEPVGLVAQAPLFAPVRDRLVVRAQPQDAGDGQADARREAAGLHRLLDRALGA